MRWSARGLSLRQAAVRSASVFLRDAGHGLLEVCHNSLALLGLLTAGFILFAAARADLRHSLEAQTLSWLQARQEARMQPEPVAEAEPDLGEPDAISRATASGPEGSEPCPGIGRDLAGTALPRGTGAGQPPRAGGLERRRVGQSRSDADPRRHGRGIELQSFRAERGRRAGPDAGHDQDPRRQVRSLRRQPCRLRPGDEPARRRASAERCIARAGGLEAGLRSYVGAANTGEDGGYAAKVLAEQITLRVIAAGGKVRTTAAAAPVTHAHIEPPAPAPADLGVVPPATSTEPVALPDKIALMH